MRHQPCSGGCLIDMSVIKRMGMRITRGSLKKGRAQAPVQIPTISEENLESARLTQQNTWRLIIRKVEWLMMVQDLHQVFSLGQVTTHSLTHDLRRFHVTCMAKCLIIPMHFSRQAVLFNVLIIESIHRCCI